jgi:hypothetical protein
MNGEAAKAETPVFPTLEEQEAYWKQKENEHEAHLDEQHKNGKPRRTWSPEQKEKFRRTMRKIWKRKQQIMAMSLPAPSFPDPKPQPELQAPKFCPACGEPLEPWGKRQ